jgi:hypothetical protein
MQEQNVHTFKPKKGPIPQANRDALFDFEERTRQQQYRDLAESSKQQFPPKPEAARSRQSSSHPRSILNHRQSPAPTVVSQGIHAKASNTGDGPKRETENNAIPESSQSAKSPPAKDAASIQKKQSGERTAPRTAK